jgi:hypothetical protein
MRPLIRPTLSSAQLDNSGSSLLMSAFGPYCSVSEEPIYDVGFVWDKVRNSEHPFDQPAGEDWENLLLLAHGTFEAWRRHHDEDAEELVLPDQEITFNVYDPVFIYAEEEVNVICVDESGEDIVDREIISPFFPSGMRRLVIVRGANSSAQATIDTFSLNTAFFDPEANVLRITENEYLSRTDARLGNRTAAWQRAMRAAGSIADVDRNERPSVMSMARSIAASTGFWSVWATVLWERFQDTGPLASVLGSENLDRELVGAGPHNEFPGTSPEWIRGRLRRVG